MFFLTEDAKLVCTHEVERPEAPGVIQRHAPLVVCLDNEGYPASLEVGKLYRLIPDEEAAANGLIRVIDESGEDYAFEARRFHMMNVPPAVGKVLLAAFRS